MVFEQVKTRVTELAQEGASTAKDMAEVASLKVLNATEQRNIRKAYMEIGKLYFAQHADEPDDPYSALCIRIAESKDRIARNNARVEEIRRADGISDEDIKAMEAEIRARRAARRTLPRADGAPVPEKKPAKKKEEPAQE